MCRNGSLFLFFDLLFLFTEVDDKFKLVSALLSELARTDELDTSEGEELIVGSITQDEPDLCDDIEPDSAFETTAYELIKPKAKRNFSVDILILFFL